MNTQCFYKVLHCLLVSASLVRIWPTAQAASLTPINADVNAAINGRINYALASNGGTAFASSSLASGYLPARANDGVNANNGNSWIASTVNSGEYLAIAFPSAITLEAVVWDGQTGYNGRSAGTWSVQYTADASPSGSSAWTEIGQYVYVESSCAQPMPRSYFDFPPIANVTGIRLVILTKTCGGSQPAVQELEAYGPLAAPPSITSFTGPTNAIIYSAVTFSVVSSGAESIQWASNGIAILGATASTFGYSIVTPDKSASYTVVLTNSVGSVTSAPIVLTVLPFLNPSLIGNTDINTAINGRINYALGANGATAFASSSSGSGFEALRVNDGINNNSGNPWVAASTNSGEFVAVAFTNATTLEAVAWDGETGYNGSSAGIWSVQYTTNASPSSNSTWSEIAQYVYVEPSCAQPMPRSYFHFPSMTHVTGIRLVTLRAGCNNSPPAVQELEAYGPLVVAPIITSLTPSTNVIVSNSVTLAVVSSGAESFQWTKNGTNILGATASTLSIASVTTNDVATYRVVLANVAGTVTSGAIALTVATGLPVITGLSPSTNLVAYSDFTFAVVSSGAVAFQWNSNGVPIVSATNPTYTVLNLQTNFRGSFTVVLGNSIGSVTSAPVVVMVTPAPTYPTYQAAVLADNPIHYYPLNETSGSIATDLGSLTSGGATYTGGFSLGQPPISPSIVGTSVHLDGNAGTFVDCGQIYPGTSASVEAWVQLDSGARANFNSFLCRFDGCFEADFNTTDHIGFIARNNSNVLGQAYMPTTSARAVWHHVVGTFDTNGVVTVYVDGVQGAAAALGGTLQNAGPTPDRVLIGATRNGSASSFNWLGYLGQVAIYDHALSAVAVRVHYATSGALSSKPVITSQPIGGTVTAGNDFTFNVGYIGTTTSIQWFKNGVAIPGATNSSYPIIFARTNNSGTYQVVLGNYVGSTNSATAVLTVTPAPTYTNYQAAVLADNPVNYYPLNETSGTTATDLGSIPSPGTYSGGFTLGQPSSIGLGNCVHFDGQPGTFVNCGFIYPGLSASVEAWVNLDSSAPNTYQAIVARWSGSFELDLNSSGIGGINAFNDSNTGGSAYMPTAATRGVWHHLVGVFDTNGVLTIYVDGAKGAATTLGGGLQNSGPLDDVTRIGATRDGVTPPNSFNFQGYIAQVAIYDHALSAASIRAHYITSQLQSSPQLVTINQESGMEVLSWAAYPIGYFLQYANSLSGPYQTYTGLISRIGTNSVAVVPSGLFYRLTK